MSNNTWPCPGKPEALAGQLFGMYHCEFCGEMQVAGMPHLAPQFPAHWEEPFPVAEEPVDDSAKWSDSRVPAERTTSNVRASAMTNVDVYLNFLLHAILGKLSEADALMRMAGDGIRVVAVQLAARHPPPPAPLYRGMLLDPTEPYNTDPRITFLSWSEDKDVALWFACPRSAVSEPLAKVKPPRWSGSCLHPG